MLNVQLFRTECESNVGRGLAPRGLRTARLHRRAGAADGINERRRLYGRRRALLVKNAGGEGGEAGGGEGEREKKRERAREVGEHSSLRTEVTPTPR